MNARAFATALILTAAAACPGTRATEMDDETARELSRRSGIPLGELTPMLADCSASQQSMQFCAWRDQLEAERTLESVLRQGRERTPRCAAQQQKAASAGVARLMQRCARDAARQWGAGSLRETARLACAATRTRELAKRVQREQACVAASAPR